jgi:hypothetical protein
MTGQGWTHPRVANPDAAKDFWPELCGEATACLWRRREVYNALVDKGVGEEERDAVKDEGLAWAEISKDWNWICTGLGEPATAQTLPERTAAIDAALARFFQSIDQQGQMSNKQAEQGAYLAALRWWAEIEANPIRARLHVRALAGVGHKWRAENGYPPLGKMISTTQERIAA